MKEQSSWSSVEPDYITPPDVKKKIERNVMAQLSLMKFITGVFDLYVGKAGETILGLADSMQHEEDQNINGNGLLQRENP